MQISFDTTTASTQELRALVAFITSLFEPVKTKPAAEVIKPADVPSAGVDTADMFAKPIPPAPVPPLPASNVVQLTPLTGTGTATEPTGGIAPVVQLPPVTTGIERDGEGLPWDERIHASTKTKTAKGVWTSRRGVNDAAMIQRVKSELMATLALPQGAPAQQTVPAPVFQQPQAAAAPVTLPVAPSSPVATSTPAVTLPVAPTVEAAASQPQNLAQLMAWAGPRLASGQMAPDALNNAAQLAGLAGLAGLATRNDLVPTVFALLQ